MGKRERIIEAAIEVFCADGFDAASMADIAAKAGIGKGTLYLYFESKQSLFEETYQLCLEERLRKCSENVDDTCGVLNQLCQRLRNGMRWERSAPLQNRLVRIYLSHPRFKANARTRVIDTCPDGVEQLLIRGVERGELRPLPVELLEELYARFGSAVYYHIASHPEAAEDEKLWQEICASLRGCLGAQGAQD